MSALILLIIAILLWLLGTVAGFKLWGMGWGMVIWIGLSALFYQQILMALLLFVGVIAMRSAKMTT